MSGTPSKRNDGKIETLEQLILMSASAADVEYVDLDAGTSGDDLLFGTEAEGNLDGAGGNDLLIGAAGNNLLSGGDGDDVLISVRGDNVVNGGNGADMAVYLQGNRADYQVSDFGFGGIVEVSGAGRADLLTGVESVAFRDGTYSIDELLSGDSRQSALGIANDADAADALSDGLPVPDQLGSRVVGNTDQEKQHRADRYDGKRIDQIGGVEKDHERDQANHRNYDIDELRPQARPERGHLEAERHALRGQDLLNLARRQVQARHCLRRRFLFPSPHHRCVAAARPARKK